jgi:hypothetical protein
VTTAAATRACAVCRAPIDHLGPRARVCGTGCRARKSRGEPWPVGSCEECGARLEGRKGRQFCSARCKMRNYRRWKQAAPEQEAPLLVGSRVVDALGSRNPAAASRAGVAVA